VLDKEEEEEEEEQFGEVEPDQYLRKSTRVRTQSVKLNEYDRFPD
jgi:hypothetical protein